MMSLPLLLLLICACDAKLSITGKIDASASSLLGSRSEIRTTYTIKGADEGTEFRLMEKGCTGEGPKFDLSNGAYTAHTQSKSHIICGKKDEGGFKEVEMPLTLPVLDKTTLAPAATFVFFFVSICIIYSVPSGSILIALVAAIITEILRYADKCYDANMMLGLFVIVLGYIYFSKRCAWKCVVSVPVIFPVISELMKQSSEFSEMIDALCFSGHPFEYKSYIEFGAFYVCLPWFTKLILQLKYSEGYSAVVPYAGLIFVAIFEYAEMWKPACAVPVIVALFYITSVFLNYKARSMPQAKVESDEEEEDIEPIVKTHSMATRARREAPKWYTDTHYTPVKTPPPMRVKAEAPSGAALDLTVTGTALLSPPKAPAVSPTTSKDTPSKSQPPRKRTPSLGPASAEKRPRK